MAEDSFKFEDIVDLGDGINKAISEFKKLEKNLVKSIENITKANTKLSGSMDEIQQDIKKNVDASEQLQKSTDQQGQKINLVSTDLSKLSKKYNDNAQAQKEAKVAVESLGNSVVDQKEKVKLLQHEYDRLDPKLEGNEQKMKQLSKQIVRTRAGIKELSDASKRMNATFDSSEGSYNNLIKQNKRIKEVLRKLPPEFIETNKRAQELKNTFNQNSDALKKFDKGLGENFRNVGNYGGALGKLNGLASGGVKMLGALGLAGAFAAGAKAIFDSTKALEKNKVTLNTLLGASGKDLDAYAARATAVAHVFDAEFNEVARATNVLMESFGHSGTEALDTIEQALLRGADVQEDFLEQIIEYSVFFKEAGLNAQNMVDVMIAGEDKGIFSDKALDTVKEASIRIREMPQTTKDAIDALGISSDQLQKDLANGSKTVFEAIQEVSTEMGKLPEQSVVVGTAIADIFGGAGEDAGLAFLLSLKDITGATGDYKNSLTEAQKATLRLLESETELNEELLSFGSQIENTTKKVQAFFNELLVSGIKILKELSRLFTTAEERVASFKKMIGESSDLDLLNKKLADSTAQLALFDKELAEAGGLENFNKELQDNIIGSRLTILDEIKTIQDRIAELSKEEVEKELKDLKKLGDGKKKELEDAARRQRQAARDLAQFQLEQQIRLLEETKDNEDASLGERISAAQLITQKQIEIAEIGKESRLDVEKALIKEEKDLIKAEFDDLVMIAEKTGDDFANALFENAKIQAEGGDLSALYDKASRIRLSEIETAKNKELQLIEEANLSFRDKEQAKFDVEQEFRRRGLEQELVFLKKKAAMANLDLETRTQIAEKISEVELELSRQTVEGKEIDLMAFVDTFMQIQGILFDSKQAELERELEELNMRSEQNAEFYDREVELAGDNTEAIAQLRKKELEEEQKIENERLRLKRKIAQNDKKQAIFTALINASQAAVVALASSPPPVNFIMAALVAAAAGVEIAAIASAPLPAFAEGTKSAPGGKAIVGERGSELWVDKKKGEAGLTPSTATLVDLPKGVQVFDAVTTDRMLKNPEQLQNTIGVKQDSDNVNISNATLKHSKRKYLESRVPQQSQQRIDYDRLGRAVARNIPASTVMEIGQDNKVRQFTKHKDGSITEHKNKEADFISHKNPIAKALRELQKKVDKISK